MSDTADMTCRRNCWLVAALGAALAAVLLNFFALFSLAAALFYGVMFLVLFGGFLIWGFCTGKGQDAAPRLAPMAEVNYAPARPVQPVLVTPRPEPVRPEPVRAEPVRAEPVSVSVVATPAQPVTAAPVAAAMVMPEPKMKAARKAAPKSAAKTAAAPAQRPAAVKAAAKAAKPAVTASKPVVAVKKPATKPAAAVARTATTTPDATATPRAAGLDAAMGKTKTVATTPGSTILLSRPRGGKGDDLKQIKGVGPALEKLLNGIGVWHFDQIAAWKAKDISLVDGKMEGFKGRITRDGWVKQARVLAKGGATEFSERVAKGKVY